MAAVAVVTATMQNKTNTLLVFLPSFCLAVILLSYLPSLPPPLAYLGVALLGTLALLWLVFKRKRGKHILAALLCAWIWAVGWGLHHSSQALPQEWEGKDLILQGHIVSIPKDIRIAASFYFKPSRIIKAPPLNQDRQNRQDNKIIKSPPLSQDRQNRQDNKIIKAPPLSPDSQDSQDSQDLQQAQKFIPKKLRISWYGKPPERVLAPGQEWLLTVRLKRPHSLRNPGSFDYERWTAENGIVATGYIRKHAELLGELKPRSFHLNKLRWQTLQKLKASGAQSQGIIAALMLGERGLLQPAEKLAIRRGGISHLLAISGMHLTLVGGGIFLLFFLLLRHFPALAPMTTAALLCLGFVWFYAAWTGFSLATQRAALMLSVFLLSIIIRKFSPPPLVFFLAMAFVLLLDPLAGTNGGFYLSFAAVALVYASLRHVLPVIKPQRLRYPPSIIGKCLSYSYDLLVIQWLIMLGLLPLGLLFFHEFSWLGLGINLLAIPLTSFVIMPWLLFANLLLFVHAAAGNFLLVVLGSFIAWFYAKLVFLIEQIPGFLVLPQPGVWGLSLVALAILVLVFWLRPYNYFLGLLLLLAGLFPRTDTIPYGEFQVRFLDVGQGSAVHLRTRTKHLLYDTGASFSSGANIGSLVLAPYFKQQGLVEIDRLVVSHNDKDHAGGMFGLMEDIKVGTLMLNFTPATHEHAPQTKTLPPRQATECRRGDSWEWDGVSFRVLHPPVGENYRNKNDNSCVLLISSGRVSVLLTGDITKKIERSLVAGYPELKADLLQAPHHGSKTSSSRELLRAVAPKHVVFSSGYRNPFRHPAREVVRRYQELSSKPHLWSTWREGSVLFHLDKDSVRHLDSYRRNHKRYWHVGDL